MRSGDRQENSGESPAHRARNGPGSLIPGESGSDGLLAAVFGDQGIRRRTPQGHGQTMDTAYGKEFPRCGGKAEEERHQAAYADRHEVDTFQTEPVGGPSGEWFQPDGHCAVQRGEHTDFREAEPEMTSVQWQSEANQAETKARE